MVGAGRPSSTGIWAGPSSQSITGYETASSRSRGDIDGGAFLPSGSFPGFIPFPSDTQDAIDDLDQFTQEIRLASSGDNVLDWQIGFYYFDSDALVSTVGDGFPPLTVLRHQNESWAVFGQGSYDFTEQLTITAGDAIHRR